MEYELYHHGILGMKWGIRRYQNKDGSLTADGIKRYRTDLKFKGKYDKYTAKQEQKKAEKEKAAEVKRIEKLKAKPISKLTEEELNERINRIAMERRLSDLEAGKNPNAGNQNGGGNNQNQKNSKDAVSVGKTFVKGVLTATGGMILKGLEKKAADAVLNKMFDSSKSDKKRAAKAMSDTMDDIKDTVNDAVNGGKGEGGSSKSKMSSNGDRRGKERQTGDFVYEDSYTSKSTYNGYKNDYTYVDVDYSDIPYSSASSYSYGREAANNILSTTALVPYKRIG